MADLVTRIYSNFRGVDFRGNEVNLIRSPDALNMWKDYKETESIRTRPALESVVGCSKAIFGIFFYHDEMLLHVWDKLYSIKDNMQTTLYEGLLLQQSSAFIYNDKWYFMDGKHYFEHYFERDEEDGEEKCVFKEVVGYIPTTTIARKPMGGGTKYEDVNMLSPFRKNSFLSDGAAFTYVLDVMNIDDDFYPIVYIDDIETEPSDYKVNYAKGTITFKNYAPDAPLTDGKDNIVILFRKSVPEYVNCISNCKMVQVFDNRVFFSGNPDFPNMVWNSSLNDPSYISDLDYYKEGMDNAAVKGMVAGNNALWVFREPSDANTTIFYHTPSLDDEYGKIYPSAHSSISTGCIGKAINFNDDIVFFSERGMEAITGDVTTEQTISHRSTLIDRKLTAEEEYKNMILAEWEGYLCIFVGNHVYLADSRAMFQNGNHMEYEFFYWELDEDVSCATVKDGILYIATYSGEVYKFTNTEEDVKSYWVTPLDKFKHPNKLKTTNKRGCVAEAKGDISLYAKLEDTDFELIGTYEGVEDYFVSRIKRKKFKDIQLKFYSEKRFSLETVTLECFIGGYIKR